MFLQKNGLPDKKHGAPKGAPTEERTFFYHGHTVFNCIYEAVFGSFFILKSFLRIKPANFGLSITTSFINNYPFQKRQHFELTADTIASPSAITTTIRH